MTRLALFDLDHTLLSGDSDALWCEFLMSEGLLERAAFEPRNREMMQRYACGDAGAAEFCAFYASTLAGRTRGDCTVLLQRFHAAIVEPRIPRSARALVESHRSRGDGLVLTTATNRAITELSARAFGIDTLIATEVELTDDTYSGRTCGTLNMREGKLARLLEWLAQRGLARSTLAAATFYSDSVNDLPLLRAVGHPIAVDPDLELARIAAVAGWPVLRLER